MQIKILGVYARECKALKMRIESLLKKLKIPATIGVYDDIDMLLEYNLFKTPAVLIDDEIIENNHLINDDYLKDRIQAHFLKDDKNQGPA